MKAFWITVTAGSVIGLGGLLYLAQPAITQRLNDWRLIPQVERFSELYFANYKSLPTAAAPGTNQEIKFLVHNLEHRTTTYHYQVLAQSHNATVSRLARGDLTMDHGQTRAVTRSITLPRSEGRLMIKIELSYYGLAFGSTKPIAETQSIHYWLENAPAQVPGVS